MQQTPHSITLSFTPFPSLLFSPLSHHPSPQRNLVWLAIWEERPGMLLSTSSISRLLKILMNLIRSLVRCFRPSFMRYPCCQSFLCRNPLFLSMQKSFSYHHRIHFWFPNLNEFGLISYLERRKWNWFGFFCAIIWLQTNGHSNIWKAYRHKYCNCCSPNNGRFYYLLAHTFFDLAVNMISINLSTSSGLFVQMLFDFYCFLAYYYF